MEQGATTLPGARVARSFSALGQRGASRMTRACVVGIGALALSVGAAQAQADSGRPRYSAADVQFMAGMIAHHAQAVLIAGWAPPHGPRPAPRALCERIVVGERDEIAIMQRWLEERHQAVPDSDPRRHPMPRMDQPDRKSTRLNSSHLVISYAVFCLKKKKKNKKQETT